MLSACVAARRATIFDPAEFPLFTFGDRPPRRPLAPLAYADTIRGKAGRPVARTWTAYPGRP